MHERSDWRAMVSDMHHSHSLIQHCVCAANIGKKIAPATLLYTPINSTAIQDDPFPVNSSRAVIVSKLWSRTYMYLAIWHVTMYDNKTHIAYIPILCAKWWLYTYTANGALFYKNKCDSLHHNVQPVAVHNIYLQVGVSFQLQSDMYANVKINNKYYRTSW